MTAGAAVAAGRAQLTGGAGGSVEVNALIEFTDRPALDSEASSI